MSASALDRRHAHSVELAVEVISIADEIHRLLELASKRATSLRTEARELAGELDGVQA